MESKRTGDLHSETLLYKFGNSSVSWCRQMKQIFLAPETNMQSARSPQFLTQTWGKFNLLNFTVMEVYKALLLPTVIICVV